MWCGRESLVCQNARLLNRGNAGKGRGWRHEADVQREEQVNRLGNHKEPY